MKVLLFPLRALWALVVVTTPVLGVWVASSLTAYFNGPIWAACLAGALLFPVLPLLWELRGSVRWRRKQAAREERDAEPGERWLSFWDRMTLRTLALNLVFLAGLIAYFPMEGFTALSTRGDWMFQGDESAEAEQAREVLFAAANGLEWVHELARDNPYERERDEPLPIPEPNPQPVPTPAPVDTGEDPGDPADPTAVAGEEDPSGDGASPTRPRQPGELPAWPMKAEMHPVVASIPASAETSPEAVARYIAQREQDPFLRVKALHDYVADRIAYDAPALAAGVYPPQDPDTVFRTGKAVCAGYANLLEEMGRHTGDEIVYVTGVSRGLGGDVSGGGHAWNAAKIEGRWFLIDATWNAGTVDGTRFDKGYKTTYLFTPPHVFGVDHFPDEQHWQLRKDPISRGDFVRQPMLKPSFYAAGLRLVSPTRSQVSVGAQAVVELENERGWGLLANVVAKGQPGSSGTDCAIEGERDVEITCALPGSGTYQVWIYARPKRGQGSYPFVGQIEVLGSGGSS